MAKVINLFEAVDLVCKSCGSEGLVGGPLPLYLDGFDKTPYEVFVCGACTSGHVSTCIRVADEVIEGRDSKA